MQRTAGQDNATTVSGGATTVTGVPLAGLLAIDTYREEEAMPEVVTEAVFTARDLAVRYSGFTAVSGVDLDIRRGEITAFIGPSGCGKSTVLRCFNRMNDLIPGAEVLGALHYRGVDLYDPEVNPVEVRRRVGMVFQKPNPFPKSIRENVAYGPRVAGTKKRSDLDEIVERSLRRAAIRDQ